VSQSLFSYQPIEAEEGEVRVELREGSSRLPAWRFFMGEAEQRVMVGSSHDCDWHVVGDGVAAYHVELVWAGDVLWVAPVEGQAGNVWLNNAPLSDWAQVESDTEIGFGTARCGIGGVTDLHAPTVISSVDELAQPHAVLVTGAQPEAGVRRASGFEEVEPVSSGGGTASRRTRARSRLRCPRLLPARQRRARRTSDRRPRP
jgi:hypothetical protein